MSKKRKLEETKETKASKRQKTTGGLFVPSGLPLKALVPYLVFQPTCPSLTYSGKNCDQLFRYQHFGPQGQPILNPDGTPQIVNCQQYCLENCAAWIANLLRHYPDQVRLTSLSDPSKVANIYVDRIHFHHESDVKCDDDTVTVHTVISYGNTPGEEYHLHRLLGEMLQHFIRDEDLENEDDVIQWLCRLFQTRGTLNIRIYLALDEEEEEDEKKRRQDIYENPYRLSFPGLPNERYFGRNDAWENFDYLDLDLAFFSGVGITKEIAVEEVQPAFSCNEIRQEIAATMQEELQDMKASKFEATTVRFPRNDFVYLTPAQQIAVLHQLDNDLRTAGPNAHPNIARWRSLYWELQEQYHQPAAQF